MSAPSTTVTTQILYFTTTNDGSRAYLNINADPKTGERARNFEQKTQATQVQNVRGHESEYTLDANGFQWGTEASKHTSFSNSEEIEREYYPESIEIIKKVTGASRVVLFDHTIRRRTGEIDDSPTKRQPVNSAHVDQTPASSETRVHLHLPAEDVPALLKKRYQIINLWRPISHPADDWPIALCDYRSVDPETDVVPVALVYPDREGETYSVKYSENQRWKYLKGMRPDEYLLIKCFDSIRDGSVAQFTPHTGFEDPTTPAGTPPRQSIELRALVFYD